LLAIALAFTFCTRPVQISQEVYDNIQEGFITPADTNKPWCYYYWIEDAISYAYYPIDIHDESGVLPDHLSENVVATIPLRSSIARGSKNLVVAGRCLSSDRGANSALRVQASCMGMGQATAVAAVLASRSGITPAEVPMEDIWQLLEEHGAIVPSES